MYSAGMPILYPVAICTFFLSYWFDKIAVLKFYRKPPTYSVELPQ